MIFLTLGMAGTVEWYAPLRPDAGPTVTIRNRDGSEEVAAGTAATLNAVDTTLAEGAAAGATSLLLTDATGVSVNRRYLVSGQSAQSDVVEVKQVVGTTVTLKYPLVYAHPNASDFESTLVSYSISSTVLASTDQPQDYWSMEVAWAVGGVTQTPGVVMFHTTLHPVTNPVSPIDLYRIEPFLSRNLAVDTDLQDICTRAFDEVCERLFARSIKPYDVIGSKQFERAVQYLALFLCAEQYGQAYATEQDRLWKRFGDTLEVFQANAAVDDDQDRAVETHEKRAGRGGGDIGRA